MVYIWVRRTVDWDDGEAFLAQAKPSFLPKIEVWNETFAMPYKVFRHQVREIARLNLSRVENAVCCAWEEIPNGALVLPVDDDDWFAPDIAAVLGRHYSPDAIGYRWTSTCLGPPMRLGLAGGLRRRLAPWTLPDWVCSTNNYTLQR